MPVVAVGTGVGAVGADGNVDDMVRCCRRFRCQYRFLLLSVSARLRSVSVPVTAVNIGVGALDFVCPKPETWN